jgi:hypothetical protein
MTKKSYIFICLPLLILCLLPCQSYATDLTLNAPTQVYFSPHGGASQAIIKEINDAKSEILVQAYSFTSAPIAKALVDTHKRGLE